MPTLAMVVGACDDCGALIVLNEGNLCADGGGNSKLPNAWACPLLDEKLVEGAPIWDGPGCIDVG